MKRLLAVTLGFLFLCPSGNPFLAMGAQMHEPSKPEPVRLISYEVVQLELKKAARLRDAEGKEQSYDRAYVVTLKGSFPRNQALALELYIGDYRVPEYGSTRDGLYFRIYDPKLLERLEGKEFRYRFATAEMHSLDARFSTKGSRALRIEKEP